MRDLGNFRLRITSADARPVSVAGVRRWYLFVTFAGAEAPLDVEPIVTRYRLDARKGRDRIADLAAATGWDPKDGELDPSELVGREIYAKLIEQNGAVRVVGLVARTVDP